MASHLSAQRWRFRARPLSLALSLLCGPHLGHAQAPGAPTAPAPTASVSQPAVPGGAIDLDEAIRRAQTSEPAFAGALAEKRVTALDRSIARAALLPSAEYHNLYLFTQSNGATNAAGPVGLQSSPIFVANNTVHEYASQGSVTEIIGLRGVAAVTAASANAARAEAELEILRRGLVSTVVNLFYGISVTQRKLEIAQHAMSEAANFTELTRKREAAREGAHADVIKAQLQQQQRQREITDAQLAADRTKLELGVLLFPDPRTPYTLADRVTPDLPSRAEIEARAAANNAELKSALAALRVSNAEVLSARAAYLPDLGLNFTYGIDAPQFARYGREGVNNLGYSASVTLDIPVWDWLATQHRVKQTEIRREAVRVALTATQRRLIAVLDEDYAEALAARDQAASLDVSVRTAAESLRLTRLRYADGEATVLEVVDAQSALLLSQNAREDGLARYQAALANLQTLTGVL